MSTWQPEANALIQKFVNTRRLVAVDLFFTKPCWDSDIYCDIEGKILLYTTRSSSLEMLDNLDIGLKLATSLLEPDLWIGVIVVIFHLSIKLPVPKDKLKINCKGRHKEVQHFLRKKAEIPSQSNFCESFKSHKASSDKWKEFMHSTVLTLSNRLGSIFCTSETKLDLKKSAGSLDQ